MRLLQERAAPGNRMTPEQTVLGLETSCDETAAAVVRLRSDGAVEVLSSIIASQIADHAPYGGVVPEIAARAHVESIDSIVAEALAAAGLGYDALTGVAATAGPGLVGGVMVGLSFGKAVALARGLPLVAVNHLEGHAVSARLAPRFPIPSCCCWFRAAIASCSASMESARAAGSGPPSTTRPAKPSTRSPSPWACPIPAVRLWRAWPAAAIPPGSRCRACCWAARIATSPSRA